MKQRPSYRILDPQSTLEFPLRGMQLIEASAGTGKTYTIGNLYLKQILNGTPVSQILVVTFTNAATEELRGRIQQRLFQTLQLFRNAYHTSDQFLLPLKKRVFQQGEEDQAINLLKRAVRNMDDAAIYTIHGFCQRALTDQAFHSGQAFQVELTTDDSDLWQSAIKDWWRTRVYDLPAHDAQLFLSSLGSVDRFLTLQTPLRQSHADLLLPEQVEPISEILNNWHKLEIQLTDIADRWRQRSDELADILQQSPVLSRDKKCLFHKDKLHKALGLLARYFSSDELLSIPEDFVMLTSS